MQFSYHSVRKTPLENAKQLNRFLKTLDYDQVHFVAHSLGGIILSHLFDQFPEQRPGRIVLLGSPVKGSLVAKKMIKTLFGKLILGQSINRGLNGDVPVWRACRDTGVIIGRRSLGIGQFLTAWHLPKPNDGTVVESETQLDEASEMTIVNHSHFGMLYAQDVASLVGQFLRTGSFTQEKMRAS